ncbi:carbohydrate esterase family 4 protein [Hypholoma sublateritium FD-334 SS-4]|uniref:Carbohydrate esterase family 4 protein n=1 Tax=Hypholoma sublateritium (strain FD-334 SS-4) TaxID=945553 RepID=A0A0D2NLQ8_HYPSF|nr:carbohydrate esterase family 4 protein [Hypholoma sublateritium FD-334 SS-4]
MFASLLYAITLALVLTSGAASSGPGSHHASTLAKRAPAQVITSCTVQNTAALTFDDGPWVYLYDVSKTLLAAGAKGTFFFNGNNWGCIYDEDEAKRVKYAYDKGHQIASHTWLHSNLTLLTADQVHHQMWLVEEALIKIAGVMPAFMRPPYGAYNDIVRSVSGIRGQTIANWNFDSGDTWNITTAAEKQRYVDFVKTKPTSIIALNHDVHQQTAQVLLPFAIQTLQAAGYRLVTLAECLGKPAYQSVAAPKARDATWTCIGK